MLNLVSSFNCSPLPIAISTLRPKSAKYASRRFIPSRSPSSALCCHEFSSAYPGIHPVSMPRIRCSFSRFAFLAMVIMDAIIESGSRYGIFSEMFLMFSLTVSGTPAGSIHPFLPKSSSLLTAVTLSRISAFTSTVVFSLYMAGI